MSQMLFVPATVLVAGLRERHVPDAPGELRSW